MSSEQGEKYATLGIVVCVLCVVGVIAPIFLFASEAILVLVQGGSLVEAWAMLQSVLQSKRSLGVILASIASFPFGVAAIIEGMISAR